jgi:hypothetical protein
MPRAVDVDFGIDDFGSVEDSDLETAALWGVGFFGGLWLTHRGADRLKWSVKRDLRANHLDSDEVTKLFTLRLDFCGLPNGPRAARTACSRERRSATGVRRARALESGTPRT